MSCVDEFKNQMADVNRRLDSLISKKSIIGTKGDDAIFRQDIQNEILSIKNTVDMLSATMKQIDKEKNIDAERCHASFDNLTQKTETELNQILQKFKDTHTGDKSQQSPSRGQLTTPLFDQVMLNDEQEQIEIIEQEVNEIVSSIRNVQQLFNQVYSELQKQRNLVVLVDSEVSDAKDNLISGNRQLEIAEENQKKVTKRLIKFLLIVFSICAFITLLIILLVPSNKSSSPPSPTPQPTAAPASALQ